MEIALDEKKIHEKSFDGEMRTYLRCANLNVN